jgi:UrcA family protein
MYPKTIAPIARSVLAAAAVAFTVFAGSAAAEDVTVAIRVSAKGFDLSQPADAQKFYYKLQYAARVACSGGNRVDLAPPADPRECVEKALAGAIRAAKTPLLTQIYLDAHTLREAATRGIAVPAQLATK